MNIREAVRIFLSLPKTIYFNFKCLPIEKARHLPILIDYRTRFGDLGKRIDIDFEAHLFYIRLGSGLGTECRNWGKRPYISIGPEGRLIFKGPCNIAPGLSLTVDTGCLQIGRDFYANCNCFISCNAAITIGDDNIWGWDVEVLDSDNHQITHSRSSTGKPSCIILGDHVWVASHCHLLKGTQIPSGSVVAYGSTVNRSFTGEDREALLIGGYPAKVLAENVHWVR